MRSARLVPLLVAFVAVAAMPLLAQTTGGTRDIKVQPLGACVDLTYPPGGRKPQTYQDVHEIDAAKPTTGQGVSGILQATVADSINQSRDDQFHSVKELEEANYKKTKGPKGQDTMTLNFRVGRLATFKLCVNPDLQGMSVVYDTQIREFNLDVKSSGIPVSKNKYVTKATADMVDRDTQKFEQEAEAAIRALRSEVRSKQDKLDGDEALKILSGDPNGISKVVSLDPAGGEPKLTVRLRRAQ
jgi:hypothetical protein